MRRRARRVGGSVQTVRTVGQRNGLHRQAISLRVPVRASNGWRVVRTSDATLLRTAQAELRGRVACPSGWDARR